MKGFGLIGATPAQLVTDTPASIGGTTAAPGGSGPVPGSESTTVIHNDRAYPLAVMGFQLGGVFSLTVPAGEVWTLILQANIDLGGYPAGAGGSAGQIMDNHANGSNQTFGYGWMIDPFSTHLNPGETRTINLRLYLSRTGGAAGNFTNLNVGFDHFLCIPCL